MLRAAYFVFGGSVGVVGCFIFVIRGLVFILFYCVDLIGIEWL